MQKQEFLFLYYYIFVCFKNHFIHVDHNTPYLTSPLTKKKKWRNHVFQFLLGITAVPREIEDNGYINLLVSKQGV